MIATLLLLLSATAGEWQPLFERLPEDAAGWSFENGELHALPSTPFRTRDLYSANRYSNFEFVVEYRVSPGGNSGIRYLPLPGRIAGANLPTLVFALAAVLSGILLWRRKWLALIAAITLLAPIPLIRSYLANHPLALEFQVLDNERHRDGKRGPLYRAGALYGLSPAVQNSSRPAGEWNEARIVVCGRQIQHWLNGTLVVDVDMASPSHAAARDSFYTHGLYGVFSSDEWRRLGWQRPSLIGLQHHGEEVWFRGPKVRELACAAP